MPQPNLREATSAPEPLLPIEKKLIGWSLGAGLALLAVLLVVNWFAPIG
jgi:cell division septal protein FtsQ